MVQWLNVQDPSAGDPGWITGQATRSCRMQLKILYAATKTQRSKTKKNIFKTLFSIVEYWLFYCNHIMHSCNSDRLLCIHVTVTDFIFLGSKITMVTTAMKLKDTCSLEEKL